jgi:hypothetical protein
MTITDNSADPAFRRLGAANPVTSQAISALDLNAQYEAVLAAVMSDAPPLTAPSVVHRPRPARFSRRSLAAIAGSLAIVGAGGAVATAGWTSSHTGRYGPPQAHGAAKGDSSEWLDLAGDDFPTLARELTADIPLPPGDTNDAYVSTVFPHAGLMQADGVKETVSFDASCAWDGYWLQAHTVGDSDAEQRAATVLAQIPTWPVIAENDGGGTVDSLRVVAEAAAAGRSGPVQQSWEANSCDRLPQRWADR